ncbi:invasion associated locus B family protein [Methylobacterium nodulans]|uniref:Invasion associated locus B family protein n=1 Tax=Methylobacterium nodulans (strain LMG 21967 / CNCM I-2342 / ORS 2060) TaxID=460265 RepID=B8IW42_METNO|nr:invasion associated locus B family protein [Methylobacterium nodulans]ACL62632.1 Invasion associated locus B family protein [Methylobacterium nodulans ORS 2060]
MFVRIMTRAAVILLVLILAGLSGGGTHAAGQKRKAVPVAPQTTASAVQPAPSYTLTPGFSVKLPDVALPADVPLGQYRRVIRPFPNWTLICDENLEKKQKVCNISQTIVGPDGATVFSWSLAATLEGQPFFILRIPPGVGPNATLGLDLADGAPPITVPIKGCDAKICIAYLPVGQRLRTAAAKGGPVQVSYASDSLPNAVSFRAPLAGLTAALSVI